jgi:DNA-binding response OmpR family regulator
MSPQPKLRVLVLDDEETLNDLLCRWLKGIPAPDFEPVPALSLADAYKSLGVGTFDLAILDRRLGDGDGMDVLRRIRNNPTTSAMPVVMLSGMNQERQVILGLEKGADDYLPKPCTEELFRARIRAVLRRNREPSPNRLMNGPGFQLDPVNGRLLVDGRVEHLEPKEIEILLLLLRRPNVVHSAEFVCSEVWGKDRPARNTLESRLSSLRRKLGARAEHLENVRGSGYRLRH